ncbi:Predicted PurR-regulated permease PerM [Actinokineospora iranica]|uniref:Predicted PurR-regulated permease PerM n=1 Tax=Actinokineospora iranica TaxID=1271860 RepID=A0A1G6QGM2_9PSEU|nr:Predicted PurR-regulated permease PerM [Actinokineospora iranica]
MLRSLAAWSLRLLLIAGAVWLVVTVVGRLSVVTVPFGVAVLLAALFGPPARWLVGRGVPRGLATAGVVVGGLAVVGGLLWFVVRSVVAGMPALGNSLGESYGRLRDWAAGTLGLDADELNRLAGQAKGWVTGQKDSLVSGVWGAFSTVGSVLTGVVLTLFILVMLVHDGPRLWAGLIRPFAPQRHRLAEAGRRVFGELSAYARATVAIAVIDAVGIGVGLWATGVPLVVPLAAVVFLGAFVPLVGAFVSGLLAVAVALVSQGPVVAVIVALIVIGVQQLEGNVLEPLLMGNAVRLHALVVVLAVAIGVHLAGVAGALLAVPLVAAVRTATVTLLEAPASSEDSEDSEDEVAT